MIRRLPLLIAVLLGVLASCCAAQSAAQPAAQQNSAQPEPAKPAAPHQATFGIAIRDIYGIDFPGQTFSAAFYLWVVAPAGLSDAEYEFFDLENAQEWTHTLLSRRTEGERTVSLYDCRAVARKRWTVVDYPFDEHTLRMYFQVRPDVADRWLVVPDSPGSVLVPDLRISGWDVASLKVRAITRTVPSTLGQAASPGGTSPGSIIMPEFLVEIGISRPLGGAGLFLRTFVCLFVAVLIGFLSFYVSVEAVDVRSELCVGALFAAVGSQFVVNGLLPDSTSATLSDRLHIVVYLAILATLCIAVFLERMHRKGQPDRAHRLNRVYRKIVPTLTALLFVGMSLYYALAGVHSTP